MKHPVKLTSAGKIFASHPTTRDSPILLRMIGEMTARNGARLFNFKTLLKKAIL